jgi:hypothetical protein
VQRERRIGNGLREDLVLRNPGAEPTTCTVTVAVEADFADLFRAEHFGGRLPELFCGFDRAEFPEPVPYPTSCSPQAWASATPVQLVRTLLRFNPDLPRERLWVDPVLPPPSLPSVSRGWPSGPAASVWR